MTTLANKIDFIGFITVDHANPNGDPLNGNQPRSDYDGYGEISDVCLKRKIRNRLQDMGERILVQSNERCDDGYDSIRSRVAGEEAMKKPLAMKEKDAGRNKMIAEEACKIWTDVRAFGQVFALKKGGGIDSVSVGVRGPVSIHTAISLNPIIITSMQITKSVNTEPGDIKGSDTMGMKHRVDFGVYKVVGSINVQLAEKTGFSEDDAEKVKEALVTLFENDASSARPEGSIEMTKFYWVRHNNKTGNASSARVHHSVTANLKESGTAAHSFDDYVIDDSALKNIEGLNIEVYQEGEKIQ
ncbi:MAG: type I-C CRISPR-associated protein Cas7/Csd2 [Megasphaera massiliensis]|uniref:type I-C CRISPR-associated protein Cas7/Csd2 n=1 Tax=Megasphaera massiliensis TaxID=1232428 RepID=UPI00210BC15C|nr:type I-C CRISPR-associated protein Cas7/Csd2 [Megasphaera massiliensis]MCQ5209386.1 type I-C CRISPR-associated protein Cas7/Csd2 [Megasphaera massiliensis]MEE0658869.1 type I-C CRISPR-associated protein Cas7/Csd2 [Megasphaera massiliensis]